jgi:hypothetical protein
MRALVKLFLSIVMLVFTSISCVYAQSAYSWNIGLNENRYILKFLADDPDGRYAININLPSSADSEEIARANISTMPYNMVTPQTVGGVGKPIPPNSRLRRFDVYLDDGTRLDDDVLMAITNANGQITYTPANSYLVLHTNLTQLNVCLINLLHYLNRPYVHGVIVATWVDPDGNLGREERYYEMGTPRAIGGQVTQLTTTRTTGYRDVIYPQPTVDLTLESRSTNSIRQSINNPNVNRPRFEDETQLVNTNLIASGDTPDGLGITIINYGPNNNQGFSPGLYVRITRYGYLYHMARLDNSLLQFIGTNPTYSVVHQGNGTVSFCINNKYMFNFLFDGCILPSALNSLTTVWHHIRVAPGITLRIYDMRHLQLANNVVINLARMRISPGFERVLALSQDHTKLYGLGKNDKYQFGSLLSSKVSTPTLVPYSFKDSSGSNLIKDIEETKYGSFILMNDGKTVFTMGANEKSKNHLGLGNNVEYAEIPTDMHLLSQLNFAPNEVLEGFVDTNINDEDQVDIKSSLLRYLAWGLNIIATIRGTLPIWVTNTGVEVYGTTIDGAYYKVYNMHSHRYDWEFFGNNTTNRVPHAPEGIIAYNHPYTIFSTSI